VTRLLPVLIALTLLAGCDSASRPKVDEDQVYQDYLALGAAYMRAGEYQRAKTNLNRAQELEPRSPQVHGLFGLLFQLEGETGLAEDHFRQALRYDPDSTRTRNNFGAFLFDEGRYAEAVEHLETAADDLYSAGRSQVFENLGVSYLHLDRADEASRAFERAIDLNPSQPRALIELADIRFGNRNYVGARELFSRFLQGSDQTSRSLWLGIRLARIFGESDQEASYGLMLRNIFPASDEYAQYRETAGE